MVPPSESTPSESDAFWPSVMGDERAPFWPSEPAQPPAHRFRPFDLRGSSGVAAAARPSLLHRRSGLGLQPRQQLGPGGAIAAVAFTLLGAAVGVLLVRAQAMQPLFPLAAESLAWARKLALERASCESLPKEKQHLRLTKLYAEATQAIGAVRGGEGAHIWLEYAQLQAYAAPSARCTATERTKRRFGTKFCVGGTKSGCCVNAGPGSPRLLIFSFSCDSSGKSQPPKPCCMSRSPHQ